MNDDKEFFDEAYHLKLPNRFKVFVKIWHKGAFLTDLAEAISVTANESIYEFAKMVQGEGFVTIKEKNNTTTGYQDKFIFISDENFKNVVTRICEVCHYTFNKELYEKLLNDKKTYDAFSTTELPLEMGNSEEVNRRHMSLSATTIGYLFLVILNVRPSIKDQPELHKFVVDMLIYKLKPVNRDFHMYFGTYH